MNARRTFARDFKDLHDEDWEGDGPTITVTIEREEPKHVAKIGPLARILAIVAAVYAMGIIATALLVLAGLAVIALGAIFA